MSKLSPRLAASSVSVLLAALAVLGASTPAEARWGTPYLPRPKLVRPDQSWLQDVPEKPSRGKIAVFAFNGDDIYQPVRAEVVRLLRRRGLNVTAQLRPVDSAAQYRELSQTLNLAVYVEGEVSGEGARQTARIRLRSGTSGQRISAATFSGPTPKIVGDMRRTLWARVGPTIQRACASTKGPRRLEREPTRIDAGSPLDDTPIASRGL